MKSYKSILAILVVFAFCNQTVASENSKQQLMQRLQTLQSFTADFEQVVVDADANIVHQAAGNIALAQPNRLRWHTTMPDEILLVADGSAVYQVDYFVEQVSIISQSDAVNNNPMMLLTSNVESDWDQFDVNLSDQGFIISAKKEGPVLSLTLVFNGDKLSQILSVDSQEQESQLTFSNQAQNIPLAVDVFEPSMPDGFIIDDQRP